MLVAPLTLAHSAYAQGTRDLPFLEHSRVDPTKVLTAEACGECHIAEFEVWEKTPHATGFKTLHRKQQAETIARKMGFRLIKRDSLCFSCHYTPVVDDDRIRVVSGVSCESCHGASADWIDVHNDYGAGRDYRSEPAEARREREEKSRSAGMRRPSDLYPVVANCFSCHTVPSEELVNVGGHTTGSGGFEFVEWSQGKIRHNYLDVVRTGNPGPNATRPMERRRAMYVVGRALDLEFGLRGLAVAKEDGVYAKAMSRRVRSALAEVRAIASEAALPDVEEMVRTVQSVRVVPRNEAELLAAAEKIGAATRRFLDRHSTLDMAALDPLMTGGGGGEAAEDTLAAAGEPEGLADVGDAEPGAAGLSAGTVRTVSVAGGPGRGPASAASPAATAGQGVVGEFKRSIRPKSKHRTLGPGSCSGCHGPQNEWWFGHAHYRSADPFFDGAAANLQIARLYGVKTSEITRGKNICMDCHGTVISGKESRDVLDGVSCESCHGAAADWLEPHKDETDKQLGRRRPGHLAALRRGKLDLADAGARAERCAGCHYVTDRRLLSAGHPSGADFDFARAMAEVRHWQRPLEPAVQLASAYTRVKSARGPVPDVPRAVLAAAGSRVEGGSKRGAVATRRAVFATGTAPGSSGAPIPIALLDPPAPRPAAAGSRSSSQGPPVDLPPFPEITESTPIEDVLLMLRERLARLYRAVAPGGSGTP